MAKGCALSTGYLPRGSLSRNSVNRITDRPDMTSAVDSGRKASTQTNKRKNHILKISLLHKSLKTDQYKFNQRKVFMTHLSANLSLKRG